MNRREFLGRLLTGVAVAGSASTLFPTSGRPQVTTSTLQPLAEIGTRSLSIGKRVIEVNGKAASVFGLVQPDGTAGITLEANSQFDVTLTNNIDDPTLIHWHGLTPPWEMDGVPDNPSALLSPAEGRRYTFPVGAGGTHWMHAHTLQEQNLLAAPLIVRTADDARRDEQEVVILLHDFSFTPAEELLARLKGSRSKGGLAMNHGAMMQGMAAGMHGGHMSGMAMPGMAAMDLNDIEYDAYLANDRTLDDPQVVSTEKGGLVRLRIINGATATAFTIDTGALAGRLVAVDGLLVHPISGNQFPISMGQRLDIRLELPKTGGVHPILALREGSLERTGVILASPGADIAKIASRGPANGPVLGLELEQRLRAVEALPTRPADHRFALTLTGDMAGYTWQIDGGDGLSVRHGDRVEVAMQNMSMMAHPMHLHGHHFQVIGINGNTIQGAVRDTVLVPPMGSVVTAFDANNPGRWPLHCHHLYHMASGMMSFVAYRDGS
ncbi:multicopper oxidase domain-containing protein [Agrobacterium vitis]|uniref:multicopper oxidase family protein n=1 Tax=Agrobacterium vitis TaxID=373 RepID=UPI0012E80115|nr:multicopper oxidase domain-containing protein [Agrobacterium vitis]MUZ81403.1 multicopper oxidase domain-containing protein [Agrobacterium vitis]